MKDMWKRMKNRIKCLDNSGSALLTVVLVVAFLTILATILLYITGMNFQIKQADYQNKKSFYTGEEALEEIRANLMQDVSDATVEANASVASHYVSMSSKAVRESDYNGYFMTEMDKILQKKITDKGSLDALLKSYFTNTATNDFKLKTDSKYDLNGDGVLSYAEGVEVNTTEAYFVIRGIKMQYTNPETKVATIISTDLKIVAPDFDWSADSSVSSLQGTDTVASAAKLEKITPCNSIVYTNWKKE